MKKNVLLIALLIGLIGVSSCKKDSTASSTQYSFRMHDDPSAYDAVYIDIQQIAVTMSGSSEVVITPIHPGVYNLLDFRNGTDTLLARVNLPPGTIQQMRLILGSNNSVVVDGVSYPMTTPSAQESGLKLNINETFAANGAYDIWIDFDAGKSIVETGSGTFKLKPVIRAYTATTNGEIKGYVLPLAALTTVYAIQNNDTLVAIPSSDGFFMMSGMVSGSYQLWFKAGNFTFQNYLMTSVSVSYGTVTDVGIITLHP